MYTWVEGGEGVDESPAWETVVSQNLQAAGCSLDMVETCLKLRAQGRQKESFHLLCRQRRRLLEIIHEDQKRLDCLDYLIFSMKKGDLK